MKLLNEAKRGHLCSDPDDHACRWHRQRRWHLGANTDFTPARVWIKPVLSDGWALGDITPNLSHLWPLEPRNDWQLSEGGADEKRVVRKRVLTVVLHCSGLNHGTWSSNLIAHPPQSDDDLASMFWGLPVYSYFFIGDTTFTDKFRKEMNKKLNRHQRIADEC